MSTKSGAPWGCSTYVLVYGQCQSCRPVSFQNLNEAVEVKTSKKEEEAWLFVLEFWKQCSKTQMEPGAGDQAAEILGASEKTVACRSLKPGALLNPLKSACPTSHSVVSRA